jgi:hypothetical protein
MNPLSALKSRWGMTGITIAAGLPGGLDALLLQDLVAAAGTRGVIQVCLDDQHVAGLREQLAFFAPDLRVLVFPAWPTRMSPAQCQHRWCASTWR